jgi:dolichol kinase
VNPIVIALALLSALVFVMYFRDILQKRDKRGLVPLVMSVAVGAAVLWLLHEISNETTVFFALTFAVLFAMMPFYYTMRTRKLLAILILIGIEFSYATYTYGSLLFPFIQMLAVGTAFGVYHKSATLFGETERGVSKKVETHRDIVHIFLGAILFSLFLFLPFYYAVYIATVLIILGYLYNSASGKHKNGNLYAFLSRFERSGALYGLGALYLGVGVALILGFIHTLHFALIGLAAILFADPIATIVGINLNGPKLPYNKKKSVYGTLAFFLAVTILGFPFVGYYSIFFGAGLAVVESLKIPIDDNVLIAAVMIVLYIVYLAYLGMLPAYL